jgi:glycosyltransferase involved in cell wall biosynthesis
MLDKKNILIITPFFFPEPISTGKFNTDFAIALKNDGHAVTILCYHPFYPDWKIKKSQEEIAGIKIIRGGRHLFFTKNAIFRRFILEFSFSFFVLRKLKRYQKNKDIIIPVFPPSFAFFSILPFLNKNIKTVGMVHDLQEIYSLDKKSFLNNLMRFFIHKIEIKCYNGCSKLVFLSKEMKDLAQKMYNLEENILEVQYPFMTLGGKFTNDLNHIFNKNKKHVVYSGALGEKQNPKKLLDFFNQASLNSSNIIFHFFSTGKEFKNLKKINTNKNILFHDLVKKENLEELYQKSDVQIIPQKEGTSKGSLPSKLPNLLASNCKIFLITDPNSELEKLFKNNNLDFVVTSWDTDILVKSLMVLIHKSINYEHQLTTAKNFFTIDKMIQKVLR